MSSARMVSFCMSAPRNMRTPFMGVTLLAQRIMPKLKRTAHVSSNEVGVYRGKLLLEIAADHLDQLLVGGGPCC